MIDNPFLQSANQTLIDEFIAGSAAVLTPSAQGELSKHLSRMTASDKIYIAALFLGHDREQSLRMAELLDDSMGFDPSVPARIERGLAMTATIRILQEATSESLVMTKADRMQALTLIIERGIAEGGLEGARAAIRATEALNRMHGDEALTHFVAKVPLSEQDELEFLSKVRDV